MILLYQYLTWNNLTAFDIKQQAALPPFYCMHDVTNLQFYTVPGTYQVPGMKEKGPTIIYSSTGAIITRGAF